MTVAVGGTWWLDGWLHKVPARARPVPSSSFVGRLAPDFVLREIRTGAPVRLSDSLGRRPVVLLFGSFSCPRLFGELPKIRQLYEAHGHEVDFRLVYGKEAYHKNPEFAEFCRTHPDTAERGMVQAGLEFYRVDFPCVVADAALEQAYAPYPARVIVFDRTGSVVFDSKPALTPAGLSLPEATARLEECLSHDGG